MAESLLSLSDLKGSGSHHHHHHHHHHRSSLLQELNKNRRLNLIGDKRRRASEQNISCLGKSAITNNTNTIGLASGVINGLANGLVSGLASPVVASGSAGTCSQTVTTCEPATSTTTRASSTITLKDAKSSCGMIPAQANKLSTPVVAAIASTTAAACTSPVMGSMGSSSRHPSHKLRVIVPQHNTTPIHSKLQHKVHKRKLRVQARQQQQSQAKQNQNNDQNNNNAGQSNQPQSQSDSMKLRRVATIYSPEELCSASLTSMGPLSLQSRFPALRNNYAVLSVLQTSLYGQVLFAKQLPSYRCVAIKASEQSRCNQFRASNGVKVRDDVRAECAILRALQQFQHMQTQALKNEDIDYTQINAHNSNVNININVSSEYSPPCHSYSPSIGGVSVTMSTSSSMTPISTPHSPLTLTRSPSESSDDSTRMCLSPLPSLPSPILSNHSLRQIRPKRVICSRCWQSKMQESTDSQMDDSNNGVCQYAHYGKNIISLLDEIEDSNSHYVVMAYYNHGDLLTYLTSMTGPATKQYMDESSAKRLFIELARTLAFLHHAGVAHLDISAENVLLDDYMRPILIDLASAVIHQSSPLRQIFNAQGHHQTQAPISSNKSHERAFPFPDSPCSMLANFHMSRPSDPNSRSSSSSSLSASSSQAASPMLLTPCSSGSGMRSDSSFYQDSPCSLSSSSSYQETFCSSSPSWSPATSSMLSRFSFNANELRVEALKEGESRPGKPFYMAPEVYLGHSYDAFKADVFSMGVLLYAMIVGKQPFHNSTDAMASFILSGQWYKQYTLAYNMRHSSAHLSLAAVDLISHMLAPHDKRYTIDQVLAHPWLNSN